MFLQTNQLTGQASIIKQYLHPQLLCMSFKCSERAFACKNSSPYVFGQSVPGKPQIRPLFPQHTNFSGTCDSNNDRNHSFHFLSNWRRNGERIKTTVSNFSNTCYWVCSGSSRRSRRRRQRLWFVQFGKFAATPRKKVAAMPQKVAEPANGLSLSDLLLLLHTTTHLYLCLFTCPFAHNYLPTFTYYF